MLYKVQKFDFTRDIQQLVRLFKICFNDKKLSSEYLKWIYEDNPDGKVVAFNAVTSAGDIVGHYAAVPRNYFGENKVLLSLNTATHPDFQRKGIFGELANHTYTRAEDLGFDAIYGVANKNSIYTFKNKLGFHEHGEIRLGLRPPQLPATSDQLDFMSDEQISWRFSNPAKKYFCSSVNKINSIYTTAYGFPVYVGSVSATKRITKLSEFQFTRYVPSFTVIQGTGCPGNGNATFLGLNRLLQKEWHLISKFLKPKIKTQLSFPENFAALMDTF